MKLQLGGIYIVEVQLNNGFVLGNVCKFIRVTKTGYNFLNMQTHKCIFKKHWYKSKKGDFWVYYKKISIKQLYLN